MGCVVLGTNVCYTGVLLSVLLFILALNVRRDMYAFLLLKGAVLACLVISVWTGM